MTADQPTTNAQGIYSPSATSRWSRGLAWVLLGLPIVVFGLVWSDYAINIPKWDDHALRAFLFYFDQESTWAGKIYQLFRQHNEHRIVYDRIVTMLDYTLFGKLDYVHLMFIGNVSLVGLLAIFASALRRSRPELSRQWVWYSMPVAWLLFNLSQWENMYWGMAALQNFSVVLWVLGAFYFLSYTKHRKLAFAAGVLATLTSGNGLMVWPLGFLILLFRWPVHAHKGNRTTYWPFAGWLLGAGFVIALYFAGFEKPQDAKYVKPGILELGKGWFAVIGAAAEAIPSSTPLRNSILLGGLLVTVTLCFTAWGFFVNRRQLGKLIRGLTGAKASSFQSNDVISSTPVFFWTCAAFILGTAAIVAWARTGAGIDLLITSRYKMYSLTVIVLLYWYVAVTLPNRFLGSWVVSSAIASVLFAALSYFTFLDETIWWRHWNTTNQFNWTHSTNSPAFSIDSVSRRYTPAVPAFYDKALPIIYGSANQPAIELTITKQSGGYVVQNASLPAQGLGDAGAYLVARSPKRTYLFPVQQHQQSLVASRFRPDKLLIAGFDANIQSVQMDAGVYQLLVLTVSDTGHFNLRPTNQTIVSAGPTEPAPAKNW